MPYVGWLNMDTAQPSTPLGFHTAPSLWHKGVNHKKPKIWSIQTYAKPITRPSSHQDVISNLHTGAYLGFIKWGALYPFPPISSLSSHSLHSLPMPMLWSKSGGTNSERERGTRDAKGGKWGGAILYHPIRSLKRAPWVPRSHGRKWYYCNLAVIYCNLISADRLC